MITTMPNPLDIVEGTHSNIARKTKRWLEHEIGHAAETREA